MPLGPIPGSELTPTQYTTLLVLPATLFVKGTFAVGAPLRDRPILK
jgi:hypothetical protein